MDYCDKWRLVGLAIGLGPIVVTILMTALAARGPRNFWVGALLSGVVLVVLLVTSRAASLVLWNGLRPAICDRDR